MAFFFINKKHLESLDILLSGVPQETVLGQQLFLIMLADINKDISESNLISFADDIRIYSKIDDVTDCNTLHQD